MASIQAADINNLQNRIALIYGTGSGQSGYGQVLASSQVNALEGIIRASDINNIYADILNARVHQVGPGDLSIAQVTANLNTVAEETSQFINNQGQLSTDPDGFKKGFDDFERLIAQVEADKFTVHPSQAEQKLSLRDFRSASWNSSVYHIFTVTFDNADHRRHFFNTGGEIRFTAANTGANTPKGLDWADICSQVGTISFGYTSTKKGSVVVGNIGNYDLTSSYQEIFGQTGRGLYQQIYEVNRYSIEARAISESQLEFKVIFNDLDTGTNVDNNVDGKLESNIVMYRAVGSYVQIAQPDFATTTSISGFDVPPAPAAPEYNIGVDLEKTMYEDDENGSRIVSLDFVVSASVNNFPITLYWDTQVVNGSITTSDFSDNTLQGSITISEAYTQAERTITRTTVADSFTEGNESFRLRLFTDSARTRFVDQTGVVTIVDNSEGVETPSNPTYAITVSTTNPVDDTIIEEGQYTAFYGVQTTGLDAGTELFYTIVGNNVTASDFTSNSLSGSFTLDNNGEGSFSLTATADAFTDGADETYDVQLRLGSDTGTVVLEVGNGAQTIINETSFSPPSVQYISNLSSPVFEDVPGLYKFIVPNDVTQLTVRVIGGGGAGSGTGGGGGGGGGAAEKTITVTPGQEFDVQVGAGGAGSFGQLGQNGQPSWFKSQTEIAGLGGRRGGYIVNNAVLSAGGLGGGYYGDTGGNGGSGGQGYYEYGGGGGGGAGYWGGSNGGTGGRGGRYLTGIDAIRGIEGGAGAGGGGGGSGSAEPALYAGGGGGTGLAFTNTVGGAFGTPSGSSGTGGGSGNDGTSGSGSDGTGGRYGGGGGATGGDVSGIGFGSSSGQSSGGVGAVYIEWEENVDPPEAPLEASTAPASLDFTTITTRQIQFQAKNGQYKVIGWSPSFPSGVTTSLTPVNYTPTSTTPGSILNFTATPTFSPTLEFSFNTNSNNFTGSLTFFLEANEAGIDNIVIPVTYEKAIDRTPTYSISANKDSVNEGETLTYTVNTTFVPNGTTLYWNHTQYSDIVGQPRYLEEDDFTDFRLSGSITINNNTGTFSRTLAEDLLKEGGETFGTEIKTRYSGPRLDVAWVAIVDTSTGEEDPEYDVKWSLPGSAFKGEFFTVTASGGRPNTIWRANNGIEEKTGTFDAQGNWEGTFKITAAGTYVYNVTYDYPGIEADTVQIVINEKPNEYTASPIRFQEGSSDTLTIPSTGRHTISGRLTIIFEDDYKDNYIDYGRDSVVSGEVYFSDKPSNISGVSTAPRTWSIDARGTQYFESKLVYYAIIIPDDEAETYQFTISAPASGFSGEFPTHTITVQREVIDVPDPTYSLSPRVVDVFAQSAIRYTLTTTNVPDGELVYITVTNPLGTTTQSSVQQITGNSVNWIYDVPINAPVGNWAVQVRTGSYTGATLDTVGFTVGARVTGTITAEMQGANLCSYTWAAANASTVRVDILKPDGLRLQYDKVTAQGTDTIILNTIGSYTFELVLDGTVIDTSTVTVVAPEATGTLDVYPANGYVDETQVFIEWTTANADSPKYSFTRPDGQTIGPASIAASGQIGPAILNQIGTWTVRLFDGTTELASDSTSMIARPPEPSGSISWDAPFSETGIIESYTWTSEGAGVVQIRVGKEGVSTLNPLTTVSASGSSSYYFATQGFYYVQLWLNGEFVDQANIEVLPNDGGIGGILP